MARLAGIVPCLESVKTELTDVYVDELGMSVVLRSSFWMKANGASEAEENGGFLFLEMDDRGKKVRNAKDYINHVASAELNELIKSAKKGQTEIF